MLKRFILSDSSKLKTIKTFGNSMHPCLQNGDIITIENAVFSSVKLYDIITFKKNGRLITHRVQYKNKNYVITRGDNNIHIDGKIYPHQILGKVTTASRSSIQFDPNAIFLIQSTIYFHELKRIVRKFKSSRISYVFLKGLPLHLFYEQSIPKRLLADCDLLVAPEDYLKATSLLEQDGYKKADAPLNWLHHKYNSGFVEHSYYKIVHDTYIVLDIHKQTLFFMSQLNSINSLYPPNLANTFKDDCLADKKIVSIEQTEFPLLSIEHQILFMLIHFFRDGFTDASRLSVIKNIIKSIPPHKIDETTYDIEKIIKAFSLQNYLYTSLFILQKYFPSLLTHNLISSMSPSKRLRNYTNKIASSITVFNNSSRTERGVKRFLFLLMYSERAFIIKLLVILNPTVLFTFGWLIYRKLFLSQKNFPDKFLISKKIN